MSYAPEISCMGPGYYTPLNDGSFSCGITQETASAPNQLPCPFSSQNEQIAHCFYANLKANPLPKTPPFRLTPVDQKGGDVFDLYTHRPTTTIR